MKTHIERSLLDNGAESRAWLIGLACTGVVLLVCLGAYQLLRQASEPESARAVPPAPVVQPAVPVPASAPAVPPPVSFSPLVAEPPAPEAAPLPEAAPAPESAPEAALVPAPVQPVALPAVPEVAPTPPASVAPSGELPLQTRFAPGALPKDDRFFENSLVRIYRSKHPEDPMSNRELTESMGDHYKSRGTFLAYAEKFPDWARLYNLIKKEAGE